jgi:hypothetical protein
LLISLELLYLCPDVDSIELLCVVLLGSWGWIRTFLRFNCDNLGSVAAWSLAEGGFSILVDTFVDICLCEEG